METKCENLETVAWRKSEEIHCPIVNTAPAFLNMKIIPRESAYELRVVRTIGRHESRQRRRLDAQPRDFGLYVPLAIRFLAPHLAGAGAFEVRLTGPPGVYAVLASADLTAWSELGAVTNNLGIAGFTDAETSSSRQRFYQLRSP